MYSAPRGTTDILPGDQAYWRYVEQKASHICQLYGYERIDTPTFEETLLFDRSAGEETDVVQKEMYTFDDRGGHSMTLRPEGTAPVCRAYLERGLQNLPQPVKLFYFSSIFRYERPQAGRLREHHQFGIEALGEADASLDAEVIDLAWRFLKSLGLQKVNLTINSIGCPQCRPTHQKALREYYANRTDKLCSDCKIRLQKNVLRLLDCKEPACQAQAESAPKSVDYLCLECDDHFQKLKTHLGLLNLHFEVNTRLVRGFDYYTRTVFEIQPEEEKSQSTIIGGGRYDGLIETLGGKSTPGIGFGCGFERIILNLKKEGINVPAFPVPQVFIAFLGESARAEATRLAARLRAADIRVVVNISPKSLKAQLRHANNLAIAKTIIIGDDEVTAGVVVLRDMVTSQQIVVKPADLIDVLH